MYLYNGRLVNIRALRNGDLPILYTWASDPSQVHHLSTRFMFGEFDAFVRSLKGHAITIIEPTSAARPIGYLARYKVQAWDRSCHVTAYLVPEYRNHGHAVEARLYDSFHCFANVQVRKIYVEVYETAEHVLRILRRLGYREEGFTPQHAVIGDGVAGLWTLSLYRSDWETIVTEVGERLAGFFGAMPGVSAADWFCSGGKLRDEHRLALS